jgi:hypothetical protein
VAHVVIVGWAFSNLEKSIGPRNTGPTVSRAQGDQTIRVAECENSSVIHARGSARNALFGYG